MKDRSKHHNGSSVSSLMDSGWVRYWFHAEEPEHTSLVKSFISSSVKESGIPIGFNLSGSLGHIVILVLGHGNEVHHVGGLVGKLDLDVLSSSSWWQTWMWDRNVGSGIRTRSRSQGEVGTAKADFVLVLTFDHALAVQRLKHDLSRSSTQVEHGSSRSLFLGSNVTQKVVGSDPRVNTFVTSVHDGDTVSFHDWEWVVVFKMASNLRKDSPGFLFSEQSQTGSGLQCNRRAALFSLWHVHEDDLELPLAALASSLESCNGAAALLGAAFGLATAEAAPVSGLLAFSGLSSAKELSAVCSRGLAGATTGFDSGYRGSVVSSESRTAPAVLT
ncbi:hypothetical protein OGAPHI_000361 [Ogataea philodendri]|uniref:Uncharacterized protein n=1 Tax=Ogataea philodendri TaxID=1378263 RepID=A0A9P8TA98_9ASCO|nr:uncharacterized protein OGAPHI_000361 [Ogataea philodendri]KAH3671656.1 hypothetical protein OGAPHI_000361 [Ogataea philodendri]